MPPQPVSAPTSEEDRKRNAVWDQHWRDATAAYSDAHYRERLLGIVREYKNKGIDIGYLETALEQPDRLVGSATFGGWQLDKCYQYTSELCLLRELAYHVQPNDEPIFLAAKRD